MSFWYATYVVTGIGILVGCVVYYWLWVYGIPYIGGYRLRQEVVNLGDGAVSHKLLKIPKAELLEWDASHDAVGRALGSSRDDLEKVEETHMEKDVEK